MKAVIYARYSSDNQREESIEGQLRECKEYAEHNGLTIVNTYIDRAYSARTDNRPDFQRMVQDSFRGLFEVVLVWKLDRFSRNRADSFVYKAHLQKNGVKVVSATESISDGPEGILLESMIIGYAEFYSADLSVKIQRGQTENALKCRYNGGSLPLGLRVNDEQMIDIDPLTAPIAKEIFTRYADGETVAAITKSLNQRGLVNSSGRKFNKNSIHKMLNNRRYIGEYRYRNIFEADGIPAILDKELFEKVQKRLEVNKKAPAKKAEYLLSTKLFCGKCGVFMIGESGTSKTGKVHNYYKCATVKRRKDCDKKTVRKEWIERVVVEETKRIIFHDDVIDRLADSVVEMQKSESTALPLLRKELGKTNKAITNMLDAIQQGIITASTKQRLEQLEDRKENLEIEIAREEIVKPFVPKEKVVYWINRFREGDIDDPNYQRSIIDMFVNSVYLYDDKLVLMYNYKDGQKTITFDELKSSDMVDGAPLNGHYKNTYYFKGGFAVRVWL